MTLDAHVHVWDVERSPYDWLRGLEQIDRTLTLADVSSELRACGVDAVILVQSDDTADDTAVMRELAAGDPRVRGIVGYAPLHDPSRAAAVLEEFAHDPLMVGVRTLIHMRPEAEWMLRPGFREGVRLLQETGLTFDVVAVTESHLRQAAVLADAFPGVTFVVDHLGQPPIDIEKPSWAGALAEVARRPNVVAKLSGLYRTVPRLAPAGVDDVRPVIDHALACFGASRLLYGGDWPIAELAGGYAAATRAVREAIAELSPTERAAIGEGSAVAAYRCARASEGRIAHRSDV
ncbi:amidohydrolase family protein [Microbacterium sp.]|uniref:amidohydrolase family protein n=1 Tax=Microbacterium sp. TaxID=51671 RepID=UPI0039E444D7